MNGYRSVHIARVFLMKNPADKLLPVPPLLQPQTKNGLQIINLEAMPQQHSFSDGLGGDSLGYNRMSYLGPAFRLSREDRVQVCLRNALSDVTNLYWSGMSSESKTDGWTPVAPGKSRTCKYSIQQIAATSWYHPVVRGDTARQMYMGLGGIFIVDDEIDHSLPHQYGVDDIPLVVQDRTFDHQGKMIYPLNPGGLNGSTSRVFITNGVVAPFLDVDSQCLRLRLVNGSNLSIYRFFLSGNLPFQLIAIDGGFLEQPLLMDELILGSGERAELVVDFSLFEEGDSLLLMVEEYFSRHVARVLQMRVARSIDRECHLPSHLYSLPPIRHMNPVSRHIVMTTVPSLVHPFPDSEFIVNGISFDQMTDIDVHSVVSGHETWIVENRLGPMAMKMPYSFYLYGQFFRVIAINDEPPPPYLIGWKDTLLLWPGNRVHIVVEFTRTSGRCCYHCRMLEQETEGLIEYFDIKGSKQQ